MRFSRIFSCSFLIVVLAGSVSEAVAQSYLLRWTFDGADGVDMAATTGFGSILPMTALASGAFGEVGPTTGAQEMWAPAIKSYTAGDYFEFTFGLSVANSFVVDKIAFASASFMNGATGWEVKSSQDGYSMVLGTGVTNGSGALSIKDLGIGVGSGDTFTFRILGTGGNPAVFNGFIVDNVTVSGSLNSLSAVPEPSTYAAWLGAGMLGWVATRRRRGAAVEAASVVV